MTTSTNINFRKDLIAELTPKLLPFGFQKKGNTFVRETESGLYQVIDFEIGRSWGSTANHIRIGFGIATEEWIDSLNNWKRPKILSIADCEIRDAYCKLISVEDKTTWLPISNGADIVTAKIQNYILHTVIPYFDKLKTRIEIINMWRHFKSDMGLLSGRHLLSMGILIYLNQDKVEGEKILTGLISEKKDNDFFMTAINKTIGK